MTAIPTRVDLAIVGSGPIGALVAREVRALSPEATIAMIEAGPMTPSRAGGHLMTSGDEETKARYVARSHAAIQTKYVDAGAIPRGDFVLSGVIKADIYGIDAATFPRAAVAANVGGLGIHWSAACPRPYGAEVPLDDTLRWADQLAAAEAALSVTQKAFPDGATAARVDAVLAAAFPDAPDGRQPQRMPMAGRHDEDELFHRTGPGDVFPALAGGDPLFSLHPETFCHRVEEVPGGARLHLRPTGGGESIVLEAAAVVLAADIYRTPQLLHASGIRPAALGRHLNDHLFWVGSAGLPDVGPDPVPPAGEPHAGAWWVPHAGPSQPFHGQLHQTYTPSTGIRAIGVSWYVPTELDADSRLRFDDGDLDRNGMPRIRIDYRISDADRRLGREAGLRQRELGLALGDFDVDGAEMLPLGGSLHATGTVRIGTDERDSVADLDGLVHGTEAIYVAGNGAVPTALVCNSTLTAAGVAVGTARAVALRIGAGVVA